MASSRTRRSASGRIAVGLSGGIDSVVLLHKLKEDVGKGLSAIHIHHGLSPNADAWADFCRKLCRRLGVPLTVKKVRVVKRGEGLEAAARRARYAAFSETDADCIALAHNLDDQAETVLMNLLRGAGRRGASGMLPRSRFRNKTLLRPLLGEKYPKWRENLARAARHFSRKEAGAEDLLRKFLQTKGLRAPSEARLVEMLKQLTSRGSKTLIEHDGVRLRVYRGKVTLEGTATASEISSLQWRGERKLAIPSLGGELRFRRARGHGIAMEARPLQVRVRKGGERLQPDPRRPRRTLKNLFQEAGVPPWERDRLPLLVSGEDVVWVPGLGVDARYQAGKNAAGVLPEWRKMDG